MRNPKSKDPVKLILSKKKKMKSNGMLDFEIYYSMSFGFIGFTVSVNIYFSVLTY